MRNFTLDLSCANHPHNLRFCEHSVNQALYRRVTVTFGNACVTSWVIQPPLPTFPVVWRCNYTNCSLRQHWIDSIANTSCYLWIASIVLLHSYYWYRGLPYQRNRYGSHHQGRHGWDICFEEVLTFGMESHGNKSVVWFKHYLWNAGDGLWASKGKNKGC